MIMHFNYTINRLFLAEGHLIGFDKTVLVAELHRRIEPPECHIFHLPESQILIFIVWSTGLWVKIQST